MTWREILQDYWHRYRWLIVGGGALVIAILVTLVVLWSNGSEKMAQPQVPNQIASSASQRESAQANHVDASEKKADVTVEIKGAVNHAGVYKMSAAGRVISVVKRAGGLRNDADSRQLNQAKKLTDQMVIYVPTVGETPVSNSPGTGEASMSSESGSDSAINLNEATKEQLTGLTGVGEKKAQKIIDYRTVHNGFKSLDELKQVPGFGEKTVQHLAPHLRLS